MNAICACLRIYLNSSNNACERIRLMHAAGSAILPSEEIISAAFTLKPLANRTHRQHRELLHEERRHKRAHAFAWR
jgi:hypothetical protein